MNGMEQVAEIMEVGVGMLLIAYAFSMIWRLVFYILQAVGLQTIAKRRNIRRPWLAWIPVADLYLMGCVSDQYQQVARLHDTRRRVWLLVLGIANTVAGLVLTCMTVPVVFDMIETITQAIVSNMSEEMMVAMIEETMLPVMQLSGVSSAVNLLSLVYTVFYFVVLHDIYASSVPGSKTLLLVLSFFFRFLTPIFLFANRNRDDGMQQPQPMTFNGWNQPTQP